VTCNVDKRLILEISMDYLDRMIDRLFTSNERKSGYQFAHSNVPGRCRTLGPTKISCVIGTHPLYAHYYAAMLDWSIVLPVVLNTYGAILLTNLHFYR